MGEEVIAEKKKGRIKRAKTECWQYGELKIGERSQNTMRK